jgi:2-methylisocitrate lyase-like PEP mutase family enzyme
MGFQALATTSSGFAFTLGQLDGNVTLDEVVSHVSGLTQATDLPVSVDLENGYGATSERPARAIVRVAEEAGAVGGSIEDWDPSGHLYDKGHAAEAAHALPFPFMLTARAENHIRGHPDLDDTIARLQTYEASGADVLYAPGLRTREEVQAVCQAVSRPVNVLALPGMSMTEILEAGARRVSVGGGLTWVAVDAMVGVATAIRERGDFSGLRRAPPFREWFAGAGSLPA